MHLRNGSLIFLCAASVAMAEPNLHVSSDLDADGIAEDFYLMGGEDGDADILIEWPKGSLHVKDIAWQGAMYGQEPSLQLAPNGSVRLISMNDSIGRNRWELILTLAYRNDSYRVAGMTYRWRDTLNLADYGTCDVNLLTGRGILTIANGPEQAVSFPKGGVALTKWDHDLLWNGPCLS